jgi:hypothetical protein
MKPFVVGSVFLVAVGVLLWAGIVAASIPIVKIRQLQAEPAEFAGTIQVDDGKVAEIESLAPLRFAVAARSDPTLRLKVESPCSVPDNFTLGREVSIRGEYDASRNLFRAHRVSTQCPSKYEASKDGGGEYGKEAPAGTAAPPVPAALEARTFPPPTPSVQ